eukprot:119664_1
MPWNRKTNGYSTAESPMCVCVLLVISIGVSAAMLGFFSYQYDYASEHPTEWHYTTCFITNIRNYKDSNEEKLTDITFTYGTSNDDWSQEYTVSSYDFNNKHSESDIGTCVYSLHPNFGDKLTINNYLIHPGTSAMWLISENRYVLISWICFFAFSCVASSVAALVWKCDDYPEWIAFFVAVSLWISACVIGALVFLIMGIVIQVGLDGPLSDNISVEDVYMNMGECLIVGVMDRVSSDASYDNFTVVQYEVLSRDGEDLISVDIQTGDNVQYFGSGSWHDCYQNKHTHQVTLSEYPTVDWLQPPMDKLSSSMPFIIFGVTMFIVCVIVCLFNIVRK